MYELEKTIFFCLTHVFCRTEIFARPLSVNNCLRLKSGVKVQTVRVRAV